MKPENNIPIKLWADATVLSIFVVLFVIEVLLAATPHLGPTVRVSTKQNALLL